MPGQEQGEAARQCQQADDLSAEKVLPSSQSQVTAAATDIEMYHLYSLRFYSLAGTDFGWPED